MSKNIDSAQAATSFNERALYSDHYSNGRNMTVIYETSKFTLNVTNPSRDMTTARSIIIRTLNCYKRHGGKW